MAEWRFMPYGQGETKTNPTQSEFFTTTEATKNNIATSLIREGIQNSLDEWIDRNKDKKDRKPVRIAIFHSGNKYALKPSEYYPYIGSLENHLKAEKNGLRNLPDLSKDPMKFLVFEDFNTNGLVGNPDECEDNEVEDGTKEHNYYHFWRNVGITGKPEDKLGRWGIGKTVFPLASRINSFWGLTVQIGNSQPYLLGQSVLKSHNLRNAPQPYGYRPYGYFANYKEDNKFPYTISDNEVIEKFIKAFHIKRSKNDSGLSVIIPFLQDEMSYASIISAVISQYYLPLIKGELIVDVAYEDLSININADNLEDVVNECWNDVNESLDKKAIIELFNFVKWALGTGAAEFYSLKEQPLKNQPAWTERLWDGVDIEDLIQQYEKENKVAFKVPVKYSKVGEPTSLKTCWFKVFFAKDDSIQNAETHFVRENITIIDIKSITNQGVRAMVLIDDKDLSNLLGDSENPAHTQWQKDSQNFKDKYIDGDKCISFVVASIGKIFQKLQKPAKGLEKDLLKDIFFIPADENNDDRSDDIDDDSHKDTTDIKNKQVPQIPPSGKQMVRVSKIPGGLKIYPYGMTKDNLPKIELAIAYDTTRGNPLNKYRPFDFQLNKVPIKTVPTNCRFEFPQANVVRLEPYKEDFELTITGFDENRDLYFSIKTQYPENDSEI